MARGRLSLLGYPVVATTPGVSTPSAIRIDGTGEQIAAKFYPSQTSAITHINWNLLLTGSLGSTNFVTEIQSDSGDAPSGSVLGAASSSFVATDGWNGDKALGTDTGALTVNVPVWAVLRVASGTAPDGSNHVTGRHAAVTFGYDKLRHFNGSDWTTTSPSNFSPLINLTFANGRRAGWAQSGSHGGSPQTDIFGTNRQGLRFRVGSQFQLEGVHLRVTKSGSPSALVIQVYEGSTFKYEATIPAAEIVTNSAHYWFFGDNSIHPADTDIYIVLKQASDGGDNSNDYDLRVLGCDGSLLPAMMPTNWRMVAGTGDNPTAYSVIVNEVPFLTPIYRDAETDFEESASGGVLGSRIFTGF